MEIEHKKTALDDDAYIYTRNRDAANKENVKNLTKKQKLAYFRDYYGVKTIVAIIAVVMVCSLLNQMVFNRQTCVLSVACVDDRQIMSQEEITEDLQEYLVIENKNDYASVSYYNREDTNMNMAYVTHAATGSIDIILCSYDYFVEASNQGMLADLNELLSEDQKAALSDRFLESQYIETDDDGETVSYGEMTAYGIDVSDSVKYAEFGGVGEQTILCVHVASPNTENTLKAIDYFTETK